MSMVIVLESVDTRPETRQRKHPCGFAAVICFCKRVKRSATFWKGIKTVDTKLKPYWLTLHPNRLHTLLTQKLHMDNEAAGRIMERVLAAQQAMKSERAKLTAAQRLWDYVLTPARRELMNIRTLKSQSKRAGYTDTTQRWRALCAYEDVLVLWIARFKQIRKLGEQTPIQFAKTLRDAGKYVSDDGTHWTDYMSPRTRAPVEALFDGLPSPKTGRLKVPFLRNVPPDMREEQRTRLAKAINTELENAQTLRDVTHRPDEQERIDRLIHSLHEAQFRLDQYPTKRAYPNNWRGLLQAPSPSSTGVVQYKIERETSL